MALSSLSFEVPRNRITVLLGPNGAGKTTAFRAITGALVPAEGRVTTFGLDPDREGHLVRPRCGVVSANPALYDRLTGYDNLAYSAELYGMTGSLRPTIAAAAQRFGIADALDDAVGGYSTGMKTRLALARSILHRPELLLFDEPTSGLDPESSQAVLELIREMTAEGRTVVMCTHLLSEAEGLADHVVMMEGGTALIAGTPEDLTRQFWPNPIVRLAAEDGQVLDRLSGRPGVAAYRRDPGGARLELDDLSRLPDLVAALVADGARITRVEPHVPTLEDLYFTIRRQAGGSTAARGRWADDAVGDDHPEQRSQGGAPQPARTGRRQVGHLAVDTPDVGGRAEPARTGPRHRRGDRTPRRRGGAAMSTLDPSIGTGPAPAAINSEPARTPASEFDAHRMWVVARTELRQLLLSRDYWMPMMALGAIFFMILPAFLLLIITRVGDISMVQQASQALSVLPEAAQSRIQGTTPQARTSYALAVYLFAPIAVVVPLTISTAVGAASLVGERERGTGEFLAHSPASVREIYLGKILASFVPGYLTTLLGFGTYSLVVNLIVGPEAGGWFFPTTEWLIMMLWILPPFLLLTLSLVLRLSARVRSTAAAQQASGLITLPLIAVAYGQASGTLMGANTSTAWILGAAAWALAAVSLFRGVRSVTRNRLLGVAQ